MSKLVNTLYGCCERVLSGDQAMIAQLCAAGFECGNGQWSFQLPALHAWLASEPAGLNYSTFLKQLYASDLNERLAHHGAQIAIADNRGKVSESLYRLQRLP